MVCGIYCILYCTIYVGYDVLKIKYSKNTLVIRTRIDQGQIEENYH